MNAHVFKVNDKDQGGCSINYTMGDAAGHEDLDVYLPNNPVAHKEYLLKVLERWDHNTDSKNGTYIVVSTRGPSGSASMWKVTSGIVTLERIT